MTSLPSSGSFRVKVKPNAKKNKIISFIDSILLVDVAAPADKGKANLELVKFLSKEFKAQVRIKSGETKKEKVLLFV